MLHWYHLFLGAAFILWLGATPRDRMALRIVLVAGLASELLVNLVTVHIAHVGKLALPGLLEMGTILAMLRWARNRTGWWQVAALLVAWLAHLLCYLDVRLGTDLVYSHYEQVLAAVAACQLAACHDTLRHLVGGLWRSLRFARPPRAPALRPAGVRSAFLPPPRVPHP